MKRVLKLTLCAVILFIVMTMSKTANAAEGKLADVKYAENTDGTVKVTITFSENVEGITKLEESGWTLSGKTATKNMKPGEWYIYTGDAEDAESAVVAVQNKAKVNETVTLNDLSSTKLSNLKIADSSFGTVDGKKIKFIKEGKTQYSATATMTYTSAVTNKTITKTFDLVWDVTISNDGNNPVNPTNKTATVTYGEPTDAGVLVTVKFSQNIPDTPEAKEKLKDWDYSGDTATRTMVQGAIAAISLKYEDGSTESAKIAVPLTLEIGSKIDFSKTATDLKIENADIATIENGIITAKTVGETKMTGIATINNEEYTWTIKVKGSNDGNGGNNGNNGNSNNGNGQNSGNQSGSSNNGKDSTTSTSKLAKTGSASVAPIFIALIVIATISFIKYRKNNK
jgi:hypothetical protein